MWPQRYFFFSTSPNFFLFFCVFFEKEQPLLLKMNHVPQETLEDMAKFNQFL